MNYYVVFTGVPFLASVTKGILTSVLTTSLGVYFGWHNKLT